MKHEPITERVSVNIITSALLDEIEYIYRPLLKATEENYNDNYNPIRVLMPLIETAARIEFKGEEYLLLEKLKVPKPEIAWKMFRHGLLHYVRPFYAVIGDKRINWAIPQYPCPHYETDNSVGIYAPKLLDDLEQYLKEVQYNPEEIDIQTGIRIFITSDEVSSGSRNN